MTWRVAEVKDSAVCPGDGHVEEKAVAGRVLRPKRVEPGVLLWPKTIGAGRIAEAGESRAGRVAEAEESCWAVLGS